MSNMDETQMNTAQQGRSQAKSLLITLARMLSTLLTVENDNRAALMAQFLYGGVFCFNVVELLKNLCNKRLHASI